MAKTPLRVAVLAGGSGTRFWPLGRASRPKQVLALDGDDPRPLVVATVDRIRALSDAPPFIVAPHALVRTLRRLLPDLPASAFLAEPAPRNTAAAVVLAALASEEASPGIPLLVVPADHHVRPVQRFRTALTAMGRRAARAGTLLTLGLKPTYAATGYGWLRIGRRVAGGARGGGGAARNAPRVHRVERYVEKPSLPVAQRLLKDGRHLWNGGSFAFLPTALLRQAHDFLPEVTDPLVAAYALRGRRRRRALARAYASLPSVSLDFGVMEQARDVEVVAADLEWDDLGSFDAIARHRSADEHGNCVHGSATLVESTGCVVDAEGGHVALLGVKDLLVVRTADAVLVARKGRGEDVRKVVEALKAAGRKDLLT